MISISNNRMIRLTRGDTLELPLFINRGTKFHPVRFYIQDNPTSAVYLGVMNFAQPFEHAIIKKKYTAKSNVNEYGDLIVSITSDDTRCLYPGKYYYEIKVQLPDGSIDTVVPATEFVIFD